MPNDATTDVLPQMNEGLGIKALCRDRILAPGSEPDRLDSKYGVIIVIAHIYLCIYFYYSHVTSFLAHISSA